MNSFEPGVSRELFIMLCTWLLWYHYKDRSPEVFCYFLAIINFIYYFGNLSDLEIA